MVTAVEPNDEQALKFYTACFDGNLEEVQRIVKETPNLDLNRVIHGGTAFAAAVQNSHLDVVKYLASLGADMEIPIHDGATPIFIACYRGNMEIVRFLCSQMVNLEKPNANGNTPFAIAAQHRRLDIAEALLQHGVNIAPVNKKGSTPFFFACQEGNLDVVKFLVARDVNCTRGKNGITPFHMACYRGHLDVVTRTAAWPWPLFARRSKPALAPRYLTVEKGMNPRAIDGHGRTPLEVARRAQRDDVVAFLEQVNPDGKDGSADSSCMTTTFGQEDAPCSELNCVIA